MKTTFLQALLVSVALTAPVSVLAGDAAEGPRGGAPHQPPGPPPEALAACKGKTPGATASLTTPDGKTVKGVCELVFRPERPAQDGKPSKP